MAPRPKSPYAVQKLLGEYYASVFSDCFGLETIALRFFNVFGPRQDPYESLIRECSRFSCVVFSIAVARRFSATANSHATLPMWRTLWGSC